MARKSSQRNKGKSRTLSSRRRFKDFSTGMYENTAFEKGQKGAEPPRKGFETHVPRKMREMQLAIQRVKDMEAGKQVHWPKSREDVPRPQQPRFKKQKKSAAADADDDAVPASSSSAPPQPEPSQKSQQPFQLPSQQKRKAESIDQPTSVDKKRPKLSTDSAKPVDFARAKPAKFGATNAAPPTLHVGGHFKKVMQQKKAMDLDARKADALARQREKALTAYAAAKAARREKQK